MSSTKEDRWLTPRLVEKITGGTYLGPEDAYDTPLGKVVIDNREVEEGDVFVPILGERFDGHQFVPAAFAAGADLALCSRDLEENGGPLVRVSDTLLALQLLARAHREHFAPIVVAVTGSAGKTTTKEMIACALGEDEPTVLRTKGNFNNQTGVPKTLFGIDGETEIAVVEMGMNHAGEIDSLASCAAPNYGVITNIGTAHIEFLGSREGIFAAKTEMLPYLENPGTLFVNGDDDLLRTLKHTRENVVTFGLSEDADVLAKDVRTDGLFGTRFTLQAPGVSETEIFIPAPGKYMVYSALAAAACALALGKRPEDIAAAIQKYQPAGSRMRIVRTSGGAVIDDTYNANAPAMRAALDVLSLAEGPKVAILGEMRELGEASGRLHEEVARYAAKGDLRKLVLVGEAFSEAARALMTEGADVVWFAAQEELLPRLQDLLEKTDTVLVKASRGMRMEKTVERVLALLGLEAAAGENM